MLTTLAVLAVFTAPVWLLALQAGLLYLFWKR